jgi:hypothetical protein
LKFALFFKVQAARVAELNQSFTFIGLAPQAQLTASTCEFIQEREVPRPQNLAIFGNLEKALLMRRDRCYDFKNIFAEKIGENIGVFCSNYY